MNDKEAIREFEEWEYANYGPVGIIDVYVMARKIWLASRHVLFEKHPELVSFTVEPRCMDETDD